MKNMLALAAFGVLVVAAVGYFLGWYHISSTKAPTGHNQVTIDIDAQKVKQDVEKGKQKVQDIMHKDKGKNENTSGTPTPPPPPSSTYTVPSPPPGSTGSLLPTANGSSDQHKDGAFVLPGPPPAPPAPPAVPVVPGPPPGFPSP
jgi:hypothetical protein